MTAATWGVAGVGVGAGVCGGVGPPVPGLGAGFGPPVWGFGTGVGFGFGTACTTGLGFGRTGFGFRGNVTG